MSGDQLHSDGLGTHPMHCRKMHIHQSRRFDELRQRVRRYWFTGVALSDR